MNDRWRVALKTRSGKVARPSYVSLNRRGEIAMNIRAFAAIDYPYNVALLYDGSTRSIGVKYPVAVDEHFFPVRRYGRGGRMRIVRAARLLKQFGITVERTLVFRNVQVERLGRMPMLVLELDAAEPVAAVSRPAMKQF